MTHCVHGTDIVLDSYPPQYPEYCCQCGDTRNRTNILTPVPPDEHGPFFKSENHTRAAPNPWQDECAGAVAAEHGMS